MQMPQIPQPTYYIFKCEQSSPPGMPKPSCVNGETQGLFNYISSISFITGGLYANLDSSSKVINLADEIDKKFEFISKLENEIQELDNLIFELKRMKNESI